MLIMCVYETLLNRYESINSNSSLNTAFVLQQLHNAKYPNALTQTCKRLWNGSFHLTYQIQKCSEVIHLRISCVLRCHFVIWILLFFKENRTTLLCLLKAESRCHFVFFFHLLLLNVSLPGKEVLSCINNLFSWYDILGRYMNNKKQQCFYC